MPNSSHSLTFLDHLRPEDQTGPYPSLCSYVQPAGEYKQHQSVKMALITKVGKTTDEADHICESS